jgi:hypothetical protein
VKVRGKRHGKEAGMKQGGAHAGGGRESVSSKSLFSNYQILRKFFFFFGSVASLLHIPGELTLDTGRLTFP